MKFRHPPTLTGTAAKEFIKQDKEPLSKKQVEYLEHCREIYLNSL